MLAGPAVKTTIETINQTQADGVIGKYAIGGAVGATLYLEPAATLDVDIFVTLAPVYDYLKARICAEKDEHIVIGGWPVQFLRPSDALEQEAVAESARTTIEGVTTWVMPAEHLVAIALRTGRAKDHIRILQFVEQGAVDRSKLNDVLERHGLMPKWRQFEGKYLEGSTHE